MKGPKWTTLATAIVAGLLLAGPAWGAAYTLSLCNDAIESCEEVSGYVYAHGRPRRGETVDFYLDVGEFAGVEDVCQVTATAAFPSFQMALEAVNGIGQAPEAPTGCTTYEEYTYPAGCSHCDTVLQCDLLNLYDGTVSVNGTAETRVTFRIDPLADEGWTVGLYKEDVEVFLLDQYGDCAVQATASAVGPREVRVHPLPEPGELLSLAVCLPALALAARRRHRRS